MDKDPSQLFELIQSTEFVDCILHLWCCALVVLRVALTFPATVPLPSADLSWCDGLISSACKDLLVRMLDRNPDTRISVADILVSRMIVSPIRRKSVCNNRSVVAGLGQSHPWMTANGTVTVTQGGVNLVSGSIVVSDHDIEQAVTPLIKLKNLAFLKVHTRSHPCVLSVLSAVLLLTGLLWVHCR